MSRPLDLFVVRYGLIALTLLMALATPLTVSAAEAAVREELNLRSGPGLGYRVITVMPSGAAVTVDGDPTEGWYPVVYNGIGGWAYGAYLAIGGADGDGGGGQGTATVVTAWLNLRSGPGLGYRVVTGLSYGTTVEIVDGPHAADGHNWFQVRVTGGAYGWVAGKFLDAGERASAAAAATKANEPDPAPAPQPAASGGTIIDIITAAAQRYGQSPAAMIAVARCESALNPRAVNRSSGASGLFQFMPGTWRTTPYAAQDIFDPVANANAAAWMWSVGRRGEWVC